jgi:hypothetical protein
MINAWVRSFARFATGKAGGRQTWARERVCRQRWSPASSEGRSARSRSTNYGVWPLPSGPDSTRRFDGPGLISAACSMRDTPPCTRLWPGSCPVSTDGSSNPRCRSRSTASAVSSIVLAWHPGRRALLVIELKTKLVDVSDLLGTMDRRRRLAWRIGRERDWDPITVSTWVVIAESRTNRRAVAAHERTIRSKMPVRSRAIARWLRDPVGRVDALGFLPEWRRVTRGRSTAPRRRIAAKVPRSART